MRNVQNAANTEESLGDEVMWNDIFGPCLKDNPSVAEGFALLLSVIQDSIETGRANKLTTVNALARGIHLMFPYTNAYRIARELWMLSLRGVLESGHDSEELLSAAIDQGRLEIERLHKNQTRVVREPFPSNGKPRSR